MFRIWRTISCRRPSRGSRKGGIYVIVAEASSQIFMQPAGVPAGVAAAVVDENRRLVLHHTRREVPPTGRVALGGRDWRPIRQAGSAAG